MITLYDIPSTNERVYWSPNTAKIRMSLNLKGIPFETEWVEYPDIGSTCKASGAAPTAKNSDGSPGYTLPVIEDSSTGAVISDSFEIAKYLDKTYPATRKLFPPGNIALQAAFQEAFLQTLQGWDRLIKPETFARLNPASRDFFRKSREGLYGAKVEDIAPLPGSEKWKEDMAKNKDGLDKLESWLQAGGTKFFTGDGVTYADITVAAWVGWLQDYLPKEWGEVKAWHGGKWETFVAEVRGCTHY